MSVITLHPGLNWDTIPAATAHPMIDADRLGRDLERLRSEWAGAEDLEPAARTAALAILAEVSELVKGDVS